MYGYLSIRFIDERVWLEFICTDIFYFIYISRFKKSRRITEIYRERVTRSEYD